VYYVYCTNVPFKAQLYSGVRCRLWQCSKLLTLHGVGTHHVHSALYVWSFTVATTTTSTAAAGGGYGNSVYMQGAMHMVSANIMQCQQFIAQCAV
jgi:hypothetical protein